MTDRPDPRVEALALALYESSGMFFSWPSLAPEAHDMFRDQAARILADLDRLAWRDVATDPPPDGPPGFLAASLDSGEIDGVEWLQFPRGPDGKCWNLNSHNRTSWKFDLWFPLPPPPVQKGDA